FFTVPQWQIVRSYHHLRHLPPCINLLTGHLWLFFSVVHFDSRRQVLQIGRNPLLFPSTIDDSGLLKL
ncbi:hypothetical protein LINPERPRIM_LOCUS28992, partial [Linum perenne]